MLPNPFPQKTRFCQNSKWTIFRTFTTSFQENYNLCFWETNSKPISFKYEKENRKRRMTAQFNYKVSENFVTASAIKSVNENKPLNWMNCRITKKNIQFIIKNEIKRFSAVRPLEMRRTIHVRNEKKNWLDCIQLQLCAQHKSASENEIKSYRIPIPKCASLQHCHRI